MGTFLPGHGQDADDHQGYAAQVDREYRIDLVWAPDGGNGRSEHPGWTLYVDGIPAATTPHDLPPGEAQQWADAQLGGTVTWLPGAESWYFVAHSRRCGGGAR